MQPVMTILSFSATYIKNHPRVLFFASLCIFRLINALLLQTQFDPDEYWQTLEPAYCEAFPDRPCAYTWEWTRRAAPSSNMLLQALQGPVRSYTSVLPTFLFYQCLRLFHLDASWFFMTKGPMLMHAVFVAAVTDYCVWYCASSGADNVVASWTLLCSLTSWFQAYTLVRTYSNSLETVLLMVGVALLSAASKQTQTTSFHAPLAFWLGGISVAIRFTSLAAWIPLGVLWGVYQSELVHPPKQESDETQEETKWHHHVQLILNPCARFGALGFVVSLLIDRYFYGFWAVPALGNFHFNVVQGLGSLYGTLPAHWYLTACFPAITGTMFPILLWGPNRDSVRLWIVLGVYIFLHSLSAHKELRFLLPILPLLCIVAGKSLANFFGSIPRRVMLFFVVVNLIPFWYLGRVHQRGSLDVNRSIVQRIQQEQQHYGDLKSDPPRIYHVHYLMGCHSTPLYSHLHMSHGAVIHARYLDCSPSCRRNSKNSGVSCESDVFEQNPASFLQQEYAVACNGTVDGAPSCPTFVAMFSEHAIQAQHQLEVTMGMKEVDRFFHSIKGVNMLGGAGSTSSFGIELLQSEIVLYQLEATCRE